MYPVSNYNRFTNRCATAVLSRQRQFFSPPKTGVDRDYTVVHGHFGCIQFPTTEPLVLNAFALEKRIRFPTTMDTNAVTVIISAKASAQSFSRGLSQKA
jgi:hypothetical protein